MGEHLIRCHKHLGAYLVMRPPALERHGTAVPDIARSAVKPAFHHFNRVRKGHSFSEPAYLCRVHPEDWEYDKTGLPDQPATRSVSSKTFA